MAKTLSLDLRQRVIDAINGGMSRSAAARRFGIGRATAIRWHASWRETGTVAARAKGGDLRSDRIERLSEAIFAMVEAEKDITLVEIARRLQAEHGERFASTTIHYFFRRHGVSWKKNRARRRTRA